MSLYTRKNGEFMKLSNKQVRKLRRTQQVLDLQSDAETAAIAMRGLAHWLKSVKDAHMKVKYQELAVVALPHVDRLVAIADKIDNDIKVLQQC